MSSAGRATCIAALQPHLHVHHRALCCDKDRRADGKVPGLSSWPKLAHVLHETVTGEFALLQNERAQSRSLPEIE